MEINLPDIVEEGKTACNRYEAALISNDVGSLASIFWTSEHVIRYGATENLHGHQQISAFRKQRPSKGLDRTLQNTVITTFGRNFATVNTTFTRAYTDKTGRQSHTWARMAEGWKIAAAHVSWMDD
jgi:hypothetical protein